MTVCKTCNGLGKIKLMPFGYICTCAECKGTGETRDYMTNEEWFTSLSTEEKARFLEMICYSAWGDKNSRFKDMADYTDWMEWLKEKHE